MNCIKSAIKSDEIIGFTLVLQESYYEILVVFRHYLDMVSTNPLNRYLTIKKIKEYALLKIETIKNNCKLRFEMDEHVSVIRSLFLMRCWNQSNYRFPDRLLNDRPYDYSLF